MLALADNLEMPLQDLTLYRENINCLYVLIKSTNLRAHCLRIFENLKIRIGICAKPEEVPSL